MALPATLTNRSGTITLGGTAQSFATAKGDRKYLFIQNPSTNSDSLWLNWRGGTAVVGQPSVELPVGAVIIATDDVPRGAISIIGATTGMSFIGEEG